MKGKKPTLHFTFRNYKKIKSSGEKHILVLKLLMGTVRKQANTIIKIPPKHFDTDKQRIKSKYIESYPNVNDEIKRMEDLFPKYQRMVINGEILPDNVCREIASKVVEIEDMPLFDYVEKMTSKAEDSTRAKYKANIKGIEKALLNYKSTRIKTITCKMLDDELAVNDIANAVYKSGLKNSTQAEYLKSLDILWRKFNGKDGKAKSPFKSRNLIPSFSYGKKHPVTTEDLMNGIRKINSYQDIEAYLMWLYSFCLQGLDVADIANIDESTVPNYDKKLFTHYYPFGDVIPSEGEISFSNKYHLIKPRKKTANEGGQISCLINLFPTLFIRDWLHYLITLNRPEIAYKGKDRFRLFNIYTADKNGNTITENYNKIKAARTTLSKKCKSMFGGGIQHARHTFASIGRNYLGLSISEADAQLGHVVDSVAHKHYIDDVGGLNFRDLNQSEIIEQLNVNLVLHHLNNRIKVLYSQSELYEKGKLKCIKGKSPNPVKFISMRSDSLWGVMFLRTKRLGDWTTEHEKEYTRLMIKENRPDWYDGADGLPEKRLPNPSEYSSRLNQLYQMRKDEMRNLKAEVTKRGGVKIIYDEVDDIIDVRQYIKKRKAEEQLKEIYDS